MTRRGRAALRRAAALRQAQTPVGLGTGGRAQRLVWARWLAALLVCMASSSPTDTHSMRFPVG